MINTDDLCDAQGVADLVGLRHPNSVHTYLRRYADMPRPVIDLGPGRPRLWLRPQILAWLTTRTAAGPAAAGSVVDPAVGGAAAGVRGVVGAISDRGAK
jgi:glutathione-regulated potassium-efflux system ancillary protein KefG